MVDFNKKIFTKYNAVVKGEFMSKIEKTVSVTGFIFLFLFILSLFTSKGGMNIFGGLTLISAIIYLFVTKDGGIIKYKPFKIVILVFIVGAFFSIFAFKGYENIFRYLIKYVNPLLIIVVPLFTITAKRKWVSIFVFNLSVLASVIYGYYNFFTIKGYRTESFHDVGRWGDMLLFSIFLNLSIIFIYSNENKKKEILIKGSSWFILINSLICIILTNNRGTVLGLIISLAMFFMMLDIKKMIFVLLVGIVLFQTPFLSEVKTRIISIADSKENSNSVRIQKWKLGIDFLKESPVFGAGLVNFDDRIEKHYNEMSDEFKKANPEAVTASRGDLHNSYIQILVENGIIYFLFYIIMIGYIIFRFFREAIKKKNDENFLLYTGIFGSIAFLIAQFFHSDLYSMGGFAIYYIMGLAMTTFLQEKTV